MLGVIYTRSSRTGPGLRARLPGAGGVPRAADAGARRGVLHGSARLAAQKLLRL